MSGDKKPLIREVKLEADQKHLQVMETIIENKNEIKGSIDSIMLMVKLLSKTK